MRNHDRELEAYARQRLARMTDGLPPLSPGPRRGTTLDELLDGPLDDESADAAVTVESRTSRRATPDAGGDDWPAEASGIDDWSGSEVTRDPLDDSDGPVPGVRDERWPERRPVTPGPLLPSRGGTATRVVDFGRSHLVAVAALLLVVLLATAVVMMRARSTTLPATAMDTSSAADPVSVVGLPSASASASAQASTVSVGSAGASPVRATRSAAARLQVHVLGQVRRPGVVLLPAGARVQDAVRAAGGFTTAAGPAELNLAEPVLDGDQVLIGSRTHPRGEVRHAGQDAASTGATGQEAATATGTSVTGGSLSSSQAMVNLNTATAAQLDALPGVGPVTAQKILDWRTAHQRFSSVKELQEVDGIGDKTYARLAPHVTV